MTEGKKKVLLQDRTADELDRGVGMRFHPVTGVEISRYHSFSTEAHEYYIRSGWANCGNIHADRIGDGGGRSAGDSYLKHWLFDPYTGEMFNPEKMFTDAEWQKDQNSIQSALEVCLIVLRASLDDDAYWKVVEELKKSAYLFHCHFPEKAPRSVRRSHPPIRGF